MFASPLARRPLPGVHVRTSLSLRAVLLGVIPALLAVAGLALYLISGRYVGRGPGTENKGKPTVLIDAWR